MGKSIEDVATLSARSLPLYSGVDSLITKAAKSVMLEVSSGGLVACVLIVPNAMCVGLAFLCGAGKEMDDAAIVHLNCNVGFEK